MPSDRDAIIANLQAVAAERRRRAGDAALGRKVLALKGFQQRRFTRTYADLLASARYGPAARFFLDELYGPKDYTARDEQFAKVVSSFAQFAPTEVVRTVASVAVLHALSEALDTAMAERLREASIEPLDYVRAWQAVGRPADRHRQVALTVGVAQTLDGVTRKRLVRHALRLMRGPARAAGVTDLQRFIETGFDAFLAMQGAHEFIATIESREEAFAAALFAAAPDDAGAAVAGPLAALA